MAKKNPFGIDLDSIEDAMKNLQNAYSGGLSSLGQVDEEITDDIDPSHKVFIHVRISAYVDGHKYLLDAQLEFVADLQSILDAESGDIASILGGLGVDLSDEESNQVVEQLGKPRCIGVLQDYTINEIELFSNEGKIENGINEKAKILITLENKKLALSFESVFALPEMQASKTVYNVIPSQEKMQENVVFDMESLSEEISFSWMEEGKDNVKIEGSAKIEELKL